MHTFSTIHTLAADVSLNIPVAFVVEVGVNSTLTFLPNTFPSANIGDTITFLLRVGLSSGFQPANGAASFSFTINSTDPLWFFCAQTQPFEAGMVFAVNPTLDKTFDMFQSAAQQLPILPSSQTSITTRALSFFTSTAPPFTTTSLSTSTSIIQTTVPVGSVSPSLPPTINEKPRVTIPIGTIVGSAVGGVVVLCVAAFLLRRRNSHRIIGRRDRTDTTTTPPHITPFNIVPLGSAMVETSNHPPNVYSSPTAGPESSPFSSPMDPLAVGDLGTTALTQRSNRQKVQPRAPPIPRMHVDSGMRGVTNESVDVPPSYTSQ
ncbi:hypothetical protein BD779DRAFT_1476507 [Infundibulicybe gibba]|nr:hypothetical protein BD779DRAFT_1476507 [Infundibulicybe gibba]